MSWCFLPKIFANLWGKKDIKIVCFFKQIYREMHNLELSQH